MDVRSFVYEVSRTFTENVIGYMRKPVFFTFFLVFLYTSLIAQSEKKKVSAQPEKKKAIWTATLTGALIPISQPGLGIQPGVEYKFNDRFSLLGEITLRANKKNSKDSSELNKQYIRYKTEIRYHFLSKRKKSQQYAGLQISRASRKFINRGGFYYPDRQSDQVIFYDRAFVNSPVVTTSLQFGSVISFGKFAMDFFAGIGARFIHTTITDIVNPVIGSRNRGRDGLSFTSSYSYAGNIAMFHLDGGIRLMWRFY